MALKIISFMIYGCSPADRRVQKVKSKEHLSLDQSDVVRFNTQLPNV
ncbi:hypothetical protein [Helicobacter suis]|nr:hypothetical protein [Helicobacter suis]